MQQVLLFIQQLQAAGIPFTILRAASKRGAVIRVATALGITVIRLKPSSIVS